jgi:hypothetical protein
VKITGPLGRHPRAGPVRGPGGDHAAMAAANLDGAAGIPVVSSMAGDVS